MINMEDSDDDVYVVIIENEANKEIKTAKLTSNVKSKKAGCTLDLKVFDEVKIEKLTPKIKVKKIEELIEKQKCALQEKFISAIDDKIKIELTPKVELEEIDCAWWENVINVAEAYGDHLENNSNPYKTEELNDSFHNSNNSFKDIESDTNENSLQTNVILDLHDDSFDGKYSDQSLVKNFDDKIDVSNSEQSIEKCLNQFLDDKINVLSSEKPFKARRRLVDPSKAVSFVRTLIKEDRSLMKDEDRLVDLLVLNMRTLKQQAPAPEYNLVNDVYICSICQFKSEFQKDMDRHYYFNHCPRYVKCYACGVDFKRQKHLITHEKRCKAPDIKYVLKARTIYLGRSADYEKYKHLSRSEKRRLRGDLTGYVCDKCPATYKRVECLKAHMNLHNGIRPYRCAYCPAAYASSRHMNAHNGNFICDYCEKSFNTKRVLKAHLKVHEPRKLYQCDKCPKSYLVKMSLEHHVRKVHLQLPSPFPCKLCDKRFTYNSCLKMHMEKEHGVILMTRTMFHQSSAMMTDQEMQKCKVAFEIQDK